MVVMAASRPLHLTMSHSHSLLLQRPSASRVLECRSLAPKVISSESSYVITEFWHYLNLSLWKKKCNSYKTERNLCQAHSKNWTNCVHVCQFSNILVQSGLNIKIQQQKTQKNQRIFSAVEGGRGLVRAHSSFLETSDLQKEGEEREVTEGSRNSSDTDEASQRPWLTRPRRTSVSYLELSSTYVNSGSNTSLGENIKGGGEGGGGGDFIESDRKNNEVCGKADSKFVLDSAHNPATFRDSEGNEKGVEEEEVERVGTEGRTEEDKVLLERGASSWVWRGRKKVKNVFPLNNSLSSSTSPSPPSPFSSSSLSPSLESSSLLLSNSPPTPPPSPSPSAAPSPSSSPPPSTSFPSPSSNVDTRSPRDISLNSKAWFPYANEFDLGLSKPLTSGEVIQLLDPFMMEGRRSRMERVVSERTYTVVPVVEGLADLGNVSAVCRTAEAFGFQSVQVISSETKRRFKDNRNISMGTDKWLDVELWDKGEDCLKTLRKRGYRIAATHISPDTIPIYDIDWTIPTAIIFGNEHRGVSKEALEASDILCSIPMSGMVDSFNISVAAAISMHQAVRDRIQRQGFHGDLTEDQRQTLVAEFMLRHNRHTKNIIEQLLSQKGVQLGQSPKRPLERFLEKAGTA